MAANILHNNINGFRYHNEFKNKIENTADVKNLNFNDLKSYRFNSPRYTSYEYITEKGFGYHSSEIFEIFDKCETTEIQSLEETGAVVTEYEDILNITNEQENIYIKNEEFIDTINFIDLNSNNVNFQFIANQDIKKQTIQNENNTKTKESIRVNQTYDSDTLKTYDSDSLKTYDSDSLKTYNSDSLKKLLYDVDKNMIPNHVAKNCFDVIPSHQDEPKKMSNTQIKIKDDEDLGKKRNEALNISETLQKHCMHIAENQEQSHLEEILSEYVIIEENCCKKENNKFEILIQVVTREK